MPTLRDKEVIPGSVNGQDIPFRGGIPQSVLSEWGTMAKENANRKAEPKYITFSVFLLLCEPDSPNTSVFMGSMPVS